MVYQDIQGKAFRNSITYEMSLNRKFYFRQVYNLLDFVSDLGGLLSFSTRICVLIVIGLQSFGST